ncbi:DUF3352 domain-containing protein [Microbispora sp. NPDC049125]|uniref:DUF3352 domain-containing protein n=1 Tax=Microbispora sp. NPDC049125 TaxID=3154929 RepID=UPI003467106D
MPADTHSGYPFPEDQDLDRTISYRTPRGLPQAGDQHTRRLPNWPEPEEIGVGTVPAALPAALSAAGPAAPLAAPPAGAESAPPRRRGRGWIAALVAAVLVAVVCGGGVWAAAKLSGGGTQPQDVLPGGAIAYARLDLDPSAGQKLALFSIARKFSSTRGSFTGDDPRQALFTALRQDVKDVAHVDYAKDVEPWLGDRIGVAVLPPAAKGEEPGVAVAVQVKDEAAARTGLRKLGLEDGAAGLAFRDGYALLAQTQKQADAYAQRAPLARDPQFADDLAALGEPGVLSAWADLGKIVDASGAAEEAAVTALAPLRGTRFAGALRFDGSYAELTGITRGGAGAGGAKAEPVAVGSLPDSTVAAASVSGLGEALGEQWPRIQEAAKASPGAEGFTTFLDQARDTYGLALPDDLVTLLGKSITVALDERGLDGDQPGVGAVLTGDPAKAQQVLGTLEKMLADSGAPVQLATASGDGRLVVASTQEYAGRLAQSGTLGEDETFRLAVPEAQDATYAFYANLDKIEKLYLGSLQGEERADAAALRAVGLSGKATGGEATFTLRVVFN